jgi:hypothetical protein
LRKCGSRRPSRRSLVQRSPRRKSQPPLTAGAHEHPVGAAAQRIFNEGRRQHAGAQQGNHCTVSAAARALASAPCVQLNTTIVLQARAGCQCLLELLA